MKQMLLFVSAIVLFSNCRKAPDFSELSSNFVVSTSLDSKASFGSYHTYYIADTIRYIGGQGSDSIIVGANAQQLTQAIKDNMAARGYTLVSRSSNPDLGLALSAIKNINVVVDYYPGWWDGYWPGCYWYCYSYYYPWTTTYAYTTGTIILNMYDLKNATETQQIKGIWNLTGLGALGASTSVNLTLGVNAIDQGFAQSPYLKTN